MDVTDEYIERLSWMVRPCHLYKEEYSDCTSLHSRIHQQFITAEFSNCGEWKRDYDNCLEWTEKNNRKAFGDLIKNELTRRKERLAGHLGNDIWEKRTEFPPPGWNDPLPQHIEDRIKNSYLALKAKEIREGSQSDERKMCIIS